jgi:hypothetical protein
MANICATSASLVLRYMSASARVAAGEATCMLLLLGSSTVEGAAAPASSPGLAAPG